MVCFFYVNYNYDFRCGMMLPISLSFLITVFPQCHAIKECRYIVFHDAAVILLS
jgi:hypothetical protein